MKYIVREIRAHRTPREISGEDIKFYLWMTRIEDRVFKKIRLTLDELPDEPYRDLFASNTDPSEIARMVVRSFKNSL